MENEAINAKVPIPRSEREAQAIDHAFGYRGWRTYTTLQMFRTWGASSIKWELESYWDKLTLSQKDKFMKEYWKYLLGVSDATK
jgi:hypothetical protein